MTADETIDATGKYVIPGGIDAHTHMELPFGGTFAKDTFETGTRAAAFGGTTSIVDFAVQAKGASLRAGLDTWMAKAEGNAVTDYGFHMIMSDVNDDTLAEMDALVAEGVPDFKLFTAYPGVFYQRRRVDLPGDAADRQERRPDHDARRERDGHRRRRGADRRAPARPIPIGHGLARNAVFEGEATNRVIRLAEAAGGARLHRPPVRERRPRRGPGGRDRGTMAFAETCPQYLFLSLDDMGNGFEGAKFVCSPPLRPKETWDDLWRGLVKDDLQLVATDHCPFDFHGQKELGVGDFRKIPNGLPGRRGSRRPPPRRRRGRRPDQPGTLGGDHLDGPGQDLRDVPAQGRRGRRLRCRPRHLRPGPAAHDLRGDAPHGRRLLVLRGPRRPGRQRHRA